MRKKLATVGGVAILMVASLSTTFAMPIDTAPQTDVQGACVSHAVAHAVTTPSGRTNQHATAHSNCDVLPPV